MHPQLSDWVRDSSLSKRVEVIVTFADPVVVPPFPEPRCDQARNSAANLARLAAADILRQGLIGKRAVAYSADSTEMAQLDSASVLQTFWITRAVRAEIALGKIDGLLARRQDITYIAPNVSGEPPPVCSTTGGTSPSGAREKMNAGYLWGLTGDFPWMSLLDTGVDRGHRAFHVTGSTTTPHLGPLLDCGAPNCVGGDPADGDCYGHGTSSAAILVSLPYSNDCQTGMASLSNPLAAYKVFNHASPCANSPALVRSAVLNAFQQSVPKLDRIVVAEMQAYGADGSDIANAANQAFNAGTAVVGAQGNITAGISLARSPGNARYAIAAGGYNVIDTQVKPCLLAGQCTGPTPDLRIKPEVLGPSATYVASKASEFANFGGTSGATPYVAGSLALLRRAISSPGSAPVDPGQLYAMLIAGGDETWVPSGTGSSCLGMASVNYGDFNPARGAGRFRLPGAECRVYVAKLDVPLNVVVPIAINLSGIQATSIDAAIWWPDRYEPLSACNPARWWWWHIVHVPFGHEPSMITPLLFPVWWCPPVWVHSDLDLEIAAPGQAANQSTARSLSQVSVFERASVRAAAGAHLQQGVWNVRVVGTTVPATAKSATQTVYCAVIVRP